jgi:hypothetical protein
MNDSAVYEIIETKYEPTRAKSKLDFQGTLEEAEQKAWELARQNIGTRYAVFRQGSYVAESQAYYRTTIKCPRCGEIIPLE